MVLTVVLQRAGAEGRVLLTHDARTVPEFAYRRAEAGLPTPGVFVVPNGTALGVAIADLVLLTGASLESEYDGRVVFLPL